MKKIKANKKGFTLIEIIVVLVIMGILLAIAIPSILGYVNKANDAKFMALGRSINTESSALIQEQIMKNPDMSDAEFKALTTEFRRKFIWTGVAGSKNPISDYIKVDLPENYQIRSLDFNFDGKYSQNEWVYDKNAKNHTITKVSIILQKTKTDGTQNPLQEFVYIVTLSNKNVYVYGSTEEAMEALDKSVEEGPIFPS